ncbi:MAG: sugar phosphate isomerase/epimerase [Armatimonadota bacterium]|jgi:sugar phosphate isomerase/epimerase
MQVGLLTAPFRKESLEHVVNWAGEVGFDCLELTSGPGRSHCDPDKLSDDDLANIQAMVKDKGLVISSLANYCNMTDADQDKRAENLADMKKLVDVARKIGIEVVCTTAGHPIDGNRMRTINRECPGVFSDLCAYARERGIKIALENWWATNIMNLAMFQRIFEVVPDENFGLNFDPSHLLWQGIDYRLAVETFADRIFHTHAKDTEVLEHKLAWLGNQERGWWRYVIPGYGKIDWGEYIACLRLNGYNGVLSIEHEDKALGREEGFIRGMEHLRQFA